MIIPVLSPYFLWHPYIAQFLIRRIFYLLVLSTTVLSDSWQWFQIVRLLQIFGPLSICRTECVLCEADTESESQQRDTPPPKRKKYSCVFRAQVFPWARPLKKGSTYALCNHDISLSKGGSKDLRRHEQTSLHSQWDSASSGSSSLDAIFGPSRAAIKFGYFLGEHHLRFLLADHCGKLFSSVFPDSVIARDFKCSRTKATAIVKVIAQDMSGNR